MSETLEMKRTLEARKLIERAKGILQYKHSLTEEEAYLRLRNESRRLRRPMRDLAEAVILADDLNKKGVGEGNRLVPPLRPKEESSDDEPLM
jgi:AmiR/NasT family two-component response regulator